MKKYFLIMALIAIAIFQSCVPQRKFEELQAKSNACETELKASRDSLRKYTEGTAEMKRELEELRKSHSVLVRDTALLGSSYRQQKEQYDQINDLNKEIRSQLELLRKGSEADAQKLSSELQKAQYELQKKEDMLNVKEADLAKKQKRIDELEALLKKQADAAEALREKVANALNNFKDKGLTVVEKDGKVYVSMEAKLLFASGSYSVDKEGKKILVELARVLESQQDLEVIVEGHTDTDKLNSSNTPKDNWELSVLRSTSVVKIMLENSKMDPKKISAAGRSEYIPVDVSDKAKNRRIEIILMPNLDELYKLIEGK